ncbi:MAG: hypothetical protein IJ375_04740 [Oscillospiraceae bacterium]|nr:hypothetical protein [Oscillospiraceae bacterium]
MKKLISVIMLLGILFLAGCNTNKSIQGIDLPFEESEIQQIALVYYTGDPSDARQKIVTGSEDIQYIYNMFSNEIHLETNSRNLSDPSDTLRIRIGLKDGHGFSMQYEGFGVKEGLLSSSDGDFAYFTPTDVAWLWDQLTAEYEASPISLAPSGATESPVK